MQKNLTGLFAFAIFVLIVGLGIIPVQAHTGDPCPHSDPTHKHCIEPPPNDGGGGGKISLVGTFDDINYDGLKSDGGGNYVDGAPGIDNDIKNGLLTFDLNSDGSTGNREFAIELTCPINEDCADTIFHGGFFGGGSNGSRYAVLNVNAIDVVPEGAGSGIGRDVRLHVRFDDENQPDVYHFHFYGDPPSVCVENNSGGGPINVKHPDAVTWVIEATADDKLCLWSNSGNGGSAVSQYLGTYSMPFKLVLTKP